MEKAYDSVKWCAVEQIMKGLGFPTKFISWVMTCVSTVSYSAFVNGELAERFSARRGLRQGDPMSPLLFVLVMEYLHRGLLKLRNCPDFNFHLRCQKLEVVHLCFADDLLLFAMGDVGSIMLLNDVLQGFSAATGLKPTWLRVKFSLVV